MTIRQESRYRRCETLTDTDGKSYVTWSTTREYPHYPDDRFYKVEPGDRIDNLSYKFFGDPQYFWVIAEYNKLPFPLPLVPGTILRFPSVTRLMIEVLE